MVQSSRAGTTTARSPGRTRLPGRGFRWIELWPGIGFTCGLTTDSLAWCWGSPVRVLGGLSIEGVAPGGEHTCAVATGERGYCWGWNHYGQLGNGAVLPASVERSPVAVGGGLRFDRINTASYASCGVTTTARVFCWGGSIGHLGDGTTSDRSTPGPVSGG